MDVRRANFESLRMRFYENDHVQRAVGYLARRPAQQSERRLKSLLRDHIVSPIMVDDETWIRDSFDFLLAYYGILEIASIAGSIDQLDVENRTVARAHLEQPDVVRYYEEHYPLLLPILFRERLEGNHALRETISGDASQVRAQSLVMRFTQLIGVRNADKDIDRFLWLMDDGRVGNVGWQGLLQPLSNLETFLELTGRPGDDPRAEALRGFTKYIAFCESLAHLLTAAADFPLLQSAMWHYNAYWFVRIGDKLGPRLDLALTTLENWRQHAEEKAVFDRKLAKTSNRVRNTMQSLMSPELGRPLLDAGGYTLIETRHPNDVEVVVWRFARNVA